MQFNAITRIIYSYTNMFKHCFIKKTAFFIAVLGVQVGCTDKDDPAKTATKDPDATCGLVKVYRDNKNKNVVSTLLHKDGYGSDTVYYYNKADTSLINYTTYLYNQDRKVIERKIFGPKNVLETVTTLEYWPNGQPKFQRVERKLLATLFDQANARQESKFDEKGNITEYKNFSTANSLMNHLTYVNTYNNERLQKSVRQDHLYTFSGTSEYTYNAKGLKSVVTNKNLNGEITGKTEFLYNDKDQLVELKNYSGTTLTVSEAYVLNGNGVLLQSQQKLSDGAIQAEHHYQYDCSK